MAWRGRTPIHEPHNDDNVPDEDEMDYFEYLTSVDYFTPAQLIHEARFGGVVTPLLNHEKTAYVVPYYNLLKEGEKLIQIDDKDKFSSFLSNNQDNEILHEILPLLLLEICRYCSVSCATAFFESPLHERVNLHHQLATSYAPLEYAAFNLSLGFTQILLNHGADPDRYDCYSRGYPLHTAITQLCSYDYVKQWTYKHSIFKLFYVLCLPELKEPLDTIRLLASHTKRPLEKFLDCYIVHHNISMLIILVMAARDDLLVPSTNGGSIESTRIGQYLTRELSSNRLLVNWMSKSALNEILLDVKVKVETLWRAIDYLERYLNSPLLKSVPKNDVPFHIAVGLVNDAGFELKREDVLCDDMECMRPNLSSSIAIDLSKRIDLDKHSVFGSGLRVRKPALGSLFSSLSKSNSQHHEYHTIPAMNSNMLKPMETQLSKAVPLKPALHNVIASARKCAPLMWIAKRSIK